MPTFYWIANTATDANIHTNWSDVSTAGPPLAAWPGTSPDASDTFIFDSGGVGNCNWNIAAAQDINVGADTGGPYSGTVDFVVDVALQGLKLNGDITTTASKTLTFTTPLSSYQDASSRNRFVLNYAAADPGTALTYAFTPGAATYYLDNGPYPNVSISTNPMVLGYNVPTSTTFDNADDATIHIKGTFSATSTGGFSRGAVVPDASVDTAVAIKFDNTSFTYAASTLDFMLATAHFRGITLPLTGDIANYGGTTFTAKHYGLVIFASSAGDKVTVPSGLILDCFSLVVQAGARLISAANANPSIIRTQTQPKVAGGWSFEAMSAYEYSSPRGNIVRPVSNGGTGLSTVPDNALLMGNDQQALSLITAGTNGYVLTMVSGSPAWAAASGGGGASALDDLTDVTLTSPEEPQILVYDDGTSQWINDTNDRLFLRAYNDTASTLSKGKVVYITGFQNANVAKVELARADSASTMPGIGIVWEDITAGSEGYIVAFGKANGVAANHTAGDTLYVSPTTAGELTNTRPSSASHLVQNVGILFKPDASNAVMKVTGIGRANDVPNDISAVSASFTGDVDIGGKLTVTGLIDPTGLELDPQGANPGGVAANTLWLDSGDSNRAKIGSARVIQAGDNVGDLTDDGTYLTSESDPVFSASQAALITNAGSGQVITAPERALIGTALQAETDPIYSGSPAALITNAGSGIVISTAERTTLGTAIQPGKYEAGSTPISAKGFIDTGSDTSWISQTEGSRSNPSANGSGSSQVFSNGVNGLVTAWNQDLVTTQGITYSSGIWTIDTAGVYEVYAKLGFLDGDASGSNTIGNPSSSSFIQTMTHILYSSDGTDPTASEILVRGPVYLQTNGTGISAKGSEAKTVRRFDVGDKIAIGCFVRLQSNQSSSKKYRLRSGYYNECVIRRVG